MFKIVSAPITHHVEYGTMLLPKSDRKYSAICSQPLGQAVYGVLLDMFSEMPYAVMISAAVFSFIIALYSKMIFARLDISS